MSVSKGPIYINAAFQGGGAKLIELIAAAHALQEIHDDVKEYANVSVSLVAGTSAGSIAAALFFCGADFNRIIHKHKDIEKLIKKQFPKFKISKLYFLLRMLINKPLFSEKSLSTLLVKLFEMGKVEKPRKSIKTFKKTARCKDLYILAADLHNEETGEHDANSSKGLIEALVDSAAIPLVFRNARSSDNSAHIVDGGIFENLPGRVVAKGINEHTLPIAFSFEAPDEDEELEKLNAFEYAKFVLGKIINKGVKDAYFHYKDEAIISLPNQRETLDFYDIFHDDFENEYEVLKETIKSDIIGAVNNRGIRDVNWHSERAIDIIRKNRKISESATIFSEYVLADKEFHIDHMKLEANANSLANQNLADFFTLTSIFDGKKNTGLQFLRTVFFDSSEGALTVPEIHLEISKNKKNWEPIPVMFAPIYTDKDRRSLLVVLPEPMRAGKFYRYTKIEKIYNGFEKFQRNVKDYYAITSGVGRSIEKLTIKYSFPSEFAPKAFTLLNEENDRDLINDIFESASEKSLYIMTNAIEPLKKSKTSKGITSYKVDFEPITKDVANYVGVVYI